MCFTKIITIFSVILYFYPIFVVQNIVHLPQNPVAIQTIKNKIEHVLIVYPLIQYFIVNLNQWTKTYLG